MGLFAQSGIADKFEVMCNFNSTFSLIVNDLLGVGISEEAEAKPVVTATRARNNSYQTKGH
jgi:hypothetical protein